MKPASVFANDHERFANILCSYTSIYRERMANEHERSTNGDPAAGYRERTANERVRERFANAVSERSANAQPCCRSFQTIS